MDHPIKWIIWGEKPKTKYYFLKRPHVDQLIGSHHSHAPRVSVKVSNLSRQFLFRQTDVGSEAKPGDSVRSEKMEKTGESNSCFKRSRKKGGR